MISGLKDLRCFYCSLLTDIPAIQGLKLLHCNQCVSLKNIPFIETLEDLDISCCYLLTNIPRYENLNYFCCYGCRWINIEALEYDENLRKLIKLQKNVKNIIMSNRLIRLIP